MDPSKKTVKEIFFKIGGYFGGFHKVLILCYGSHPPVSNRDYALTSIVLPVHSLGVSDAFERGQAPS